MDGHDQPGHGPAGGERGRRQLLPGLLLRRTNRHDLRPQALHHLQPPAAGTANPADPADGVVLVDDTPILRVNTTVDPDNDPVQYWFPGCTGPNVEGGHSLASGWVDPADPDYVPCAAPVRPTSAGRCRPGRWPTASTDGRVQLRPGQRHLLHHPAQRRQPPLVLPYHLRLGSGGPAPPTPSVRCRPTWPQATWRTPMPARVLPPWAATWGWASPKLGGLTNGLLGEYYNGTAFPAAPTAPALTRTDPSVAFYWGATAPAPTVGKDDYVVRWSGNITVAARGTTPSSSAPATACASSSTMSRRLRKRSGPDDAGLPRRQRNRRQLPFPPPHQEVQDRVPGAGRRRLHRPVRRHSRWPREGRRPSWLTAPSVGPLPAGWTLSAGSAPAYTSAAPASTG